MSKDVSLELSIVRETDLAFLVSDDDTNEVWLPKSQIEYEGIADTGSVCFFIIPEWLAIEKGLI